MPNTEIIRILLDHKIKVTPQRTTILEAIISLEDHPSTDTLMRLIRFNYPNISLATIYNTINLFTRKGIIKKIQGNDNTERLDPILKNHHHLVYTDSDKIVDYEDEELDKLLKNYLSKKEIPDFKLESVSVTISGKSLVNEKTREKTRPKTKK